MKNIIIIITLFCASNSFAEGNWEFMQDDDGIKIYTRPNETTKLKDFKAYMILPVSIESVNRYMLEMEEQTQWMHDRLLTKVLEAGDKMSTIVYSITNAPWPVSDRDAVVSFNYNEKNTADFIRIDVVNVDNKYPLDEDMVRVPYIKGYWELIKIDENSTRIIFMNAASPGGNIPDWLADSFVIDMPYNSLTNLRDRLIVNP